MKSNISICWDNGITYLAITKGSKVVTHRLTKKDAIKLIKIASYVLEKKEYTI